MPTCSAERSHSRRGRGRGGLLLLLTLVFGAAIGSAAAPFAAADAKWRHLRSPHFELYSRLGDRSSRDMLNNLEILRAIFFEQLKLKERRRIDVTVYAFSTRRDFQAYAPEAMRKNDALMGFYLLRGDRAVIVMAPPEDDQRAQHTVFHEYVHHLFRVAELDPPLWFNEGTAEVLGGLQVEKKRVLLGMPLENSTLYLRAEALLPLDQLFAVDHASPLYRDEDHAGVFYAQSWALLHFWRFGDSGFSPEAVERFLQVASDQQRAGATNLREHFQASFGCDYAEMSRRLQRYIRRGSFRAGQFPRPVVPPPASYAARTVPADEVLLRLADLSLRVVQSPLARLTLLNATGGPAPDPRVYEVLGAQAQVEQDERTASDFWEQALTAGSTNPALVRELAQMEGRRWFSDLQPSLRLPADVTERLRSRLLQSLELEPAQAAGYELLALVEAFAQNPDPANVNRVIGALRTLPDQRRTLLALTRILLRVGRAEEAATMLNHVHALNLGPADIRLANALRGQLAREFPGALPEPVASNAVTIAPPAKEPGLKVPSVALPDDL